MRKRDSGFTLIEIMIALAVIAVLGLVLIPKVGTIKSQAKEAGLDTNVRMVRAYAESKIDTWDMKNISLPAIQDAFAAAFGSGKELTNPITMKTAPAPGVAASLDDPANHDRPVYVAETFDGLDIGNSSNQQYLKGTIVVAVKGATSEATAHLDNIHIYAHDKDGNVVSETIVSVDGTVESVVPTNPTDPTNPPGSVPVTGVSLDSAGFSLNVGESRTLTATVAPAAATNKYVTWSSDNSSVATVVNGVVTGVGAGQATITVTTADGGKTAACVVTVSNGGSVPVTGISLNHTTDIFLVIGETKQLTAVFTPSDATNKNVTWNSTDPAVATVDVNGLVSAISAGRTIITVTTADRGLTALCGVIVSTTADHNGDELPDYPAWTAQVYDGSVKTYVIYDGRVFYNDWYAHDYDIPGESLDPWREVTTEWRYYNVYEQNEIVSYNGKKFKARSWTQNQQPGLQSSPWQEITDQWTDFNVYNSGDIVIYEGRQFRARQTITDFKLPGVQGNPWQEITDQWTDFNVYNSGDIVIYDGRQFRARQTITNFKIPGVLDSPWQEITDQWRAYNVYNAGDEVWYEGVKYRAKWYSYNNQPGVADVWERC
jgi:prepilin-type N-terminal cleavage/methylation domain-containing protein